MPPLEGDERQDVGPHWRKFVTWECISEGWNLSLATCYHVNWNPHISCFEGYGQNILKLWEKNWSYDARLCFFLPMMWWHHTFLLPWCSARVPWPSDGASWSCDLKQFLPVIGFCQAFGHSNVEETDALSHLKLQPSSSSSSDSSRIILHHGHPLHFSYACAWRLLPFAVK